MALEQTGPSETKLEGASYEVIRRRLLEHAAELGTRCESLNAARSKLFGGRELALLATDRVRTTNNCVPRDVVSVAGHLLFGFQVFIGLKSETKPSDALSTYQFQKTGEAFDLSSAAFEGPLAFLANPDFTREFSDIFRYYKDARLLQLRRTDTRLLILTQIGATVRDVKVFRFAIDAQSRVSYMDARGEEDAVPPRPHAFVWTPTTREDQVSGTHPHVNILNEVFVETVAGDLTVKIENNTQDGFGVYREPVDDPNQTLDDAEIAYAKVGNLILLKIKPFREERTRYLIYNSRTAHVLREDSIGESCLELPENHGIIFPAGYYLESGEYKVFDRVAGLRIERVLPSPNGEDVLFVFYREEEGEYELLPYNLIGKAVQTPIRCHGYSLFPDGTMLIFRATPGQEPTRVHPVQVWQTPFTTVEFAASAPTDGSYLAKVGNADLVAGISEALTVQKLAKLEQPTRRSFEDVVSFSQRLLDAHHWLGHREAFDLASALREVQAAAALIIDEFEKLRSLAKAAREAVRAAEEGQKQLLERLRPSDLRSADAFLEALSALKRQRGALVSLKEVRSVDRARVSELEAAVAKRFDEVSAACVGFFLSVDAFKPLLDELDVLVRKVEGSKTAAELGHSRVELDRIHEGLTLLAETINGLKVADPTARTSILDGTSSAFAKQNRARAIFDGRYQELSVSEGRAEFAIRFKLLGQNVVSALSLAKTPESCDEQLGKLMLQLEELESRFGEFAEFAPEIADKREEVLAAIATRRQTIVEERQRRAQNFALAAERILSGIVRRAQNFKQLEELNTFFVSDPTLGKLEELRQQLLDLGDSVRAEELDSKLKSARQTALRALRDKTELSGGDDDTIRFGEHRFLVNTQPLELTIVAREGGLFSHLTGTDFYEPLSDAGLELGREFWDQALVSEDAEVYRGEYLAVSILLDAEAGRMGLSPSVLSSALREQRLPELVRAYAAERLDEGYEPGVHDADAANILAKALVLHRDAGLLRFSADARGLAWLYWRSLPEDEQDLLSRRAASIGRLRAMFGDVEASMALSRELEAPIARYAEIVGLDDRTMPVAFSARYLVEELGLPRPRFTVSAQAEQLQNDFQRHLEERAARRDFEEDLSLLQAHGPERIAIALAYVDAFLKQRPQPALGRYRLEVVARFIALAGASVEVSEVATEMQVTGLLGTHPRIQGRELSLSLDELMERVGSFIEERAPRYRSYKKLRSEVAARERARLRLDEFAPRVLTSFVRNRLIDEVYLPLIGKNLAKQLGAAGKTKRTDLMGLLLLVSPPGYGKTTLMEYVASRLGLVFVKVNGPALGTAVVSLDPNEAQNATARQEVEKINLALEMGNNVMLYLDDIQHTNPELLQKFISLCDAQRRIEGVWNGRARTYDLRGKKFCIVMAGNPYTESGARFQIPDMLANRADTYNLGDILQGKEQAFALSYLENALTSHPVLAPLAGREPADVHKLVAMAQGEELPASELAHGYGTAELEELVTLFKRLLQVQRTLLLVNQGYIASASQDDRYRSEPPFKLQGSYRNMNKLAEKVAAAMNEAELERLIDDHYASEAQTLTRGAEQNLLKLAEMRGRQSDEQKARWAEIKEAFVRVQRMGGKDEDPVARITGSLSLLDDQLKGIRDALGRALNASQADQSAEDQRDVLRQGLQALSRPKLAVTLHGGAPQELVRLASEQLSLLRDLMSPVLASRVASGSDGQAQRLTEIAAAITFMQRTLERGMTRPERVDVSLVGHSKTNFFRRVSSNDVCSAGGVFVATYEKLPSLGTPLELALSFPSGPTCRVFGDVEYTQDELSEDCPAGFGVRFNEVSPEARALIEEYVAVREPLLQDD